VTGASAATSRTTWPSRSADLVRLGIIGAAVAYLAVGDGAAALKAALVLGPSIGARLLGVNQVLDLLFALALAAEAILGGGNAPLSGSDTLPHIALPLLSAPVLYTGLMRLGAVPDSSQPATARSLLGAALVTVACVMALGAAWELVEWAADTALGTDYSQGAPDTLTDLLNDLIGAAGGGALVAIWLRPRPERRLP
jgi:hypothetical protein